MFSWLKKMRVSILLTSHVWVKFWNASWKRHMLQLSLLLYFILDMLGSFVTSLQKTVHSSTIFTCKTVFPTSSYSPSSHFFPLRPHSIIFSKFGVSEGLCQGLRRRKRFAFGIALGNTAIALYTRKDWWHTSCFEETFAFLGQFITVLSTLTYSKRSKPPWLQTSPTWLCRSLSNNSIWCGENQVIWLSL